MIQLLLLVLLVAVFQALHHQQVSDQKEKLQLAFFIFFRIIFLVI